MREGIHPEYHEATVKCVCGNEFKTRSTLKEISVEICSACHPFFTGQQKLVDTAGRVERFMRKYGKEYAVGGQEPQKKEAAPDEPVEATEDAPDAEKPSEAAPASEPAAEEKPAEADKPAE